MFSYFPTARYTMELRRGLFLVALIVGCSAIPTPEQTDLSVFSHEDSHVFIVNGTEAEPGSHPHMVAITTGTWFRFFLCGGSLITTRHVLTAAHCIASEYRGGSLSSSVRVTVGTNSWNSGGRSYSIARNVTHQNYVPSTIKNDIGILITKDEVQLSDLVKIITLNYDFISGGVPSRVTGWGLTKVNGTLSPTLLEISTTTIDGQQCVDDAANATIVLNMTAPPVEPHIELCTFHSVGLGNCNTDSGSPLIRIDNGQQIGIVSWGFPCALGAPDVYARISAYKNWILEHINQTLYT